MTSALNRLLAMPLLVVLMGLGAAAMLVPAAHAAVIENFSDMRAFLYSGLLFLTLTALIAVASVKLRPGSSRTKPSVRPVCDVSDPAGHAGGAVSICRAGHAVSETPMSRWCRRSPPPVRRFLKTPTGCRKCASVARVGCMDGWVFRADHGRGHSCADEPRRL